MIAYRKQSISVILRGLGDPKTRQPPNICHARLLAGVMLFTLAFWLRLMHAPEPFLPLAALANPAMR